MSDTCRPVELPDGRTIRVLGDEPMDEQSTAMFAEVVAAAERRLAAGAPLIDGPHVQVGLPTTWCVVACEQGCQQSWTVDTADFTPPLTVQDVEGLLAPLLVAHETEHGKGW